MRGRGPSSSCTDSGTCECVFVRPLISGRRKRVEDFDLQGSEHNDLPSKKLTSAVGTSKHLFPFYYISRPKKKSFDGCVQCQLIQLPPF